MSLMSTALRISSHSEGVAYELGIDSFNSSKLNYRGPYKIFRFTDSL